MIHPTEQQIEMTHGRALLTGTLTLPDPCHGIVIFAHGSGSSRLSPRNVQVAHALNQGGLGTLLFDLLTMSEVEDRKNVFDIPLLSSRLVATTHWVRNQKRLAGMPLGFFGASTGGGAALWAAAELGASISAVVSRGGRPDLAIPRLKEVKAPTLLIVGGNDDRVIELNEEALRYLSTGSLVIIPGATHLFEEPGTLDAVSKYARNWFLQYFAPMGAKGAA